jgi:hypothetical protein
VLLPPKKIGTVLDRATEGKIGIFNKGLPGRGSALLLTENEIWDVSTRESVYHGSLPVNFLSPDGRLVFDGTNVYDWHSGRRTALENPPPQLVSFNGTVVQNGYGWVGFSNRGDVVAASRSDGSVYLLDTATGRVVHTLREGGGSILQSSQGMTCFVSSFAFTSDDSVLASGELNGNISLWNTKTGDLVITLSDGNRPPCEGSAPQPTDQIFGLAFAPDERLLASQDQFGIVRVWDMASHRVVRTLPLGPGGGSRQVAFSPNGDFMVASGGFWDSQKPYSTWAVLSAKRGHVLGVFSLPGQVALGFSRDDALLTGQFWGGRVRVEKWALRSSFRIPFVSSSQASVNPSDPLLLQAYEGQVVQYFQVFQWKVDRYRTGAGNGSFPHNFKDANEEGFPQEFFGYQFVYTPGPADDQGRITSYALSARPLLYRQTGIRSFRVDQTGQVHATEEAREATASDPLFRTFQDLTQASVTTQSPAPAQNLPPSQTSPAPQVHGPSTASTAAEVNQWLSRAENQFGQGDYRGALQSCDAALRLNSSDARAKELRAKIVNTMRILGKQ